MKLTNPPVTIYDTTLRDGNQAIGIGLSLNDKLHIAEKLHDLGMHYIEGGWPTPGNQVDIEFFNRAQKSSFRDVVTVFGSTRRSGVTCSKDPFMQRLIKSGAKNACIFGKSWDLHVKKVIRTTLSENVDMIASSIGYLKKHFDTVFYDAEHFFDGYIHNRAYALKTLTAAAEAGADCLVLCDTNGGLMPSDFLRIFNEVKECTAAPLGVHMHNDNGCAVACSYLGVQQGAVHVQGTINGLGERCGNANLCTIIPGLQLKMGHRVFTDEQLKSLTPASIYISEVANISHDIRQPYVGESAFSHKAGTHADGVRKVRESFEHVEPESVGNNRRFVVSDQAGASTILERLDGIAEGFTKKDPAVRGLLEKIVRLESEGYQFEAADGSFELIAREALGQFKEPFTVKGFRVTEEKRENGELFSEATIKVEENNVFEHTAAEGDGPVNALDNAVRKALVKFFPALKEVRLEDFKVRVLDERGGTGAKVRVLIESSDQKQRWSTIGVSTNIIEASWIAMVDSLKYKLMKDSLDK